MSFEIWICCFFGKIITFNRLLIYLLQSILYVSDHGSSLYTVLKPGLFHCLLTASLLSKVSIWSSSEIVLNVKTFMIFATGLSLTRPWCSKSISNMSYYLKSKTRTFQPFKAPSFLTLFLFNSAYNEPVLP